MKTVWMCPKCGRTWDRELEKPDDWWNQCTCGGLESQWTTLVRVFPDVEIVPKYDPGPTTKFLEIPSDTVTLERFEYDALLQDIEQRRIEYEAGCEPLVAEYKKRISELARALQCYEKGEDGFLKRDTLSKNRYEYLSEEDSFLYDQVKNSEDEKDKTIKTLLEDKAKASRHSHSRSTY